MYTPFRNKYVHFRSFAERDEKEKQIQPPPIRTQVSDKYHAFFYTFIRYLIKNIFLTPERIMRKSIIISELESQPNMRSLETPASDFFSNFADVKQFL